MRLNQWMTLMMAACMLTGTAVAATPLPVFEQLQIPQCLAAKTSNSYTVLAQNHDFTIVNVPSNEVERFVVLADQEQCGHFVNVSHKLKQNESLAPQARALLAHQEHSPVRIHDANSVSYELAHADEVNAALAQVVPDNIWQTLTHLTAYPNRSATKDTGVETARWLKAQFEHLAVESGRRDTDTFFVATGRYKQPSLVTVIGKDIKAPAVVLGAHMDTLDGRMPGAGDDGSGSSSLMEAARILLASSKPLTRPVYIIWYAAEERGLVGSQYVVSHFQDKGIEVKAAMQLDMTGYRVQANDPSMWVYTDYTDKSLNQFVAQLIKTYVRVPVKYSQCGYGCSDHASWTEIGVPAAFPCESNFDEHNPNIHSASDTMDKLNLDHMSNFAKLALAFAIELAI